MSEPITAIIQTAIHKALKSLTDKKLDLKPENIHLEHPTEETHGDYATNISLTLFPKINSKKSKFTSPLELAKAIAIQIQKDVNQGKLPIKKINVATPGFINFHLKQKWLIDQLQLIKDQKNNYGKSKQPKKNRVMVEYGHPNTHKQPHIGHLFSYIAGDCLANLLAITGNEVHRVNYQGDVGPHVAKCLYAWIKKGRPKPTSLEKKVILLQECYQEGSKLYEKSTKHQQEIQAINKNLYDPKAEIQKDWQQTRQWSLDYYLEFEKNLGINQKSHYLESQVWQTGLEIVQKNTGKVFTKSQDAIVFKGEKYGLHTRVFITKQGTPTYETKDVGLNYLKMQDWPYDLTLIPTASEQNGYFKVVIEAINQALPELKGKVAHLGFGMVSLTTGKMSSRKGNILSAPELVKTVEKRVGEVLKKSSGMTAQEKNQTAKTITLGAIKYAFLKHGLEKNMAFDIDESIALDGNSGPYLQYTYARSQSVLHHNPDLEISNGTMEQWNNANKTSSSTQPATQRNPEELSILRYLYRFPEVVKLAGQEYAPSHVCTYLNELAQRYNTFYNQHQILKAEESTKNLRVLLTSATAQVIKNGLALLGIKSPEKM